EAAIDYQRVPGYEGGVVRGEEERRHRYLARRPGPSEWVDALLAARLVGPALQPAELAFGQDATRADGVDADTVFPVVNRHLAGEVDDRCFSSVVGGGAAPAQQS